MPVEVTYQFKPTAQRAARRRWLDNSDGDTPNIRQPIRMVSIDTPEKSGYAGGPAKSQPKLDKCRERLQSGFYPNIPDQFRDYLLAKLTDDAAARHVDAADRATEEFQKLVDERLAKPDGGEPRPMATIATGRLLDDWSRLLAYVSPWYESDELAGMDYDHPDRRTFNLDMVDNGWAAFFPIYPSLPRYKEDMNRAIAAAEEAWNNKRGAWDEFGEDLLLAYEYRLCIKLGTAETAAKGMESAFRRICVDLRTMTEVGLYGWHDVPPCYRLWVWEDDIEQARIDLELQQP